MDASAWKRPSIVSQIKQENVRRKDKDKHKHTSVVDRNLEILLEEQYGMETVNVDLHKRACIIGVMYDY